MKSRERVEAALAHRQPDRVPVDLGNSSWTGIHVKVVEGLRQHYGFPSAPSPARAPSRPVGPGAR